jgi:glucokinase
MRRSNTGDFYVTLDIGGSTLKAALLDSSPEVVSGSFTKVPIDSNGPQRRVIDTIIATIAEKFSLSGTPENVKAIGISFPEFLDYKQGIVAFMKDKFQNIGGIRLRDEIIKGLGLSNNFCIVFEEDSVAFLRGAVQSEKFRKFKRIIGLTLGTGLGSAFMVEGRIIRDAVDIPPNGELGCLPYEEGVVEDVVSIKGIIKIYRKITGNEEQDVSKIAERAIKGESTATRSFEEFGRRMGQIIRPYVENYKTECIVIGGQIAKSFDLFEESLRIKLVGIPSLKEIMPAESIDFCPFFGLLNTVESHYRNDNC